MNNFEKIYYGENGIRARFRDNDFYLFQNEIDIIKELINNIDEQFKENIKVDAKNVSNLIMIIFDLNKSAYINPNEVANIELLNEIYYRMEHLGKK